MRVSDEELMLAVAQGDQDAFNEVVLRHQRSAWNTAYRHLGDAAEAEDIAQEAFLRILQAAPRYRPTASFRTYLLRIVTRLCIDRWRKKGPVYTDAVSPVAAPSSDPADELIAAERQTRVRMALATLPPQQRMAVILRHYEGLQYSEIATVMNTSAKAVERLLARGRAALRVALEDILERQRPTSTGGFSPRDR